MYNRAENTLQTGQVDLDKGAVGVGHKGQAAFSVWAVRNARAHPPGFDTAGE